jgi:hypothetical protein
MENFELAILFALIISIILTVTGWILTYQSQIKTQQAISELAEQMQDMMEYARKQEASKHSDSNIVSLSADEMKDLTLWYSKARVWFSKGKGCAIDWENKHLREEIAISIRQKLAIAKTEQDIMNAFDLQANKMSNKGNA